jgi:hypothetical protein
MMGKRHLGATNPPVDVIPAPISRLQMLHPSDRVFQRILAVRDGHAAPVTCASCGCRLVVAGEVGFHFSPLGGRDARGCRVTCADADHDLSGRPLLA